MFRSEPGWLPASSYVEPVTPPVSEPDASPGVQVCFSAEWLPYVLGSLQQLCQPTAWDTASPSVLQTTLDRVQALIELFGNGEVCTMLRWSTADCALEQSTDGGATWTAISGWSIDGVASCIQTPLIDIGGAPGTGFDGPGNPGGISTAQMACNIANWIAVQVLQGSMSSIATSLAADATLLETADSIFKLITSFTGVGGAFFTVMGILIPAATAIGESALNTAAGDAGLRSDLICAIYSAISADGKVTPSNVAAILANINAISYGTPAIVGLLHNYVANLGYNGLNAIQSEGSLFDGICTCGGTPIPGGNRCAVFNGLNDYLDAASLLNTAGSTDLTITVWVYDEGASGANFIYNENDSTNAAGQEGAFISNGALVGSAASAVFTGSGQNFEEQNSAQSFFQWHHYAFIFLSSPHTVGNIYVDGAAVPVTGGTDFPGPGPSGGVTTVGYNNSAGSGFLNGKMADLRVYTSALSGTAIAAIAAGGVTGYVPEGSPAHWWAFNDGSGGTAFDYAGGDPLTWHGSGPHWGTT